MVTQARGAYLEEEKQSPLMTRALKDEGRDRSLADEAKERSDVSELHAMVHRLLNDRTSLARGIDAMVSSWSLLRDSPNGAEMRAPDKDSIAAIQQVATEAIQLAREVIRNKQQ